MSNINIDEPGRLLNLLIWPVLHLIIRLSWSSKILGETVIFIGPILRPPEQDVKGKA